MRSQSLVIHAAIAGNLAIACAKFAAATVTGSAAMLSEGLHSLIDTANGMLLFHGIRQSQKPADEEHPFGNGKEAYFWTLIVGILVFAVGGGLSMFGGLSDMVHPRPLEDPRWNYAVLLVAAVVEGMTWTIAHAEFRKAKGRASYWTAMRTSKDPMTFAVLVEDTAALAGLVIAAIGIWLAHAFDMPRLDAGAAVLIGLILATVGIVLAAKCKGLLVGEGLPPATLRKIRALANADPAVIRLARVLSMHLGPGDVLLTMEIQFRPELSAASVASAIERLDLSIRSQHPEVRFIFLESQSIAALARKVEQGPGAPP